MSTGTTGGAGNVAATIMAKGGVGKTTITLQIAAAVASVGGRVLVVDLDEQANATLMLQPQYGDAERYTVRRAVEVGLPGAALSATYPSAWNDDPGISGRGGRIDVVPGDPLFTEQVILATGSMDTLARTLDGAGEDYDLVLLDCPPSVGLVVQAGMVAASQAVLVTQAQQLSMQGVAKTTRFLDEFNDYAARNDLDPVVLAGIVINQYDGRTRTHRTQLADVRAALPQLTWTPPVPFRAVVQSAEDALMPVMSYPEPAARAVASVCARLASTLLRTFQDPSLNRLILALGSEPLVNDEDLALTAAGGR